MKKINLINYGNYDLSILLIGRSIFTYLILSRLIKLKVKICGVVSLKSKGNNDDFFDLSKLCYEKEINLHKTKDINSAKTVDWILNKRPNYIFCFGWSQLIKGKLIKNYKNRIIGFHPTELPHNRGRCPLVWSIILNIKKSAISFFYLSKGIDDGKVIDQSYFAINNNETSRSIYAKICKLAIKRIPILIKKLKKKKFYKIN